MRIVIAAILAFSLVSCSESKQSSDTSTPGANATSGSQQSSTVALTPTKAQATPIPAQATTTALQPTATVQASGLTVTVTSPVSKNSTARASAKPGPNVECTIAYRTPSGTSSEAAGLEKKASDASGEVAWSWTIGPSTSSGNGSVTVRCGERAGSATIVIS